MALGYFAIRLTLPDKSQYWFHTTNFTLQAHIWVSNEERAMRFRLAEHNDHISPAMQIMKARERSGTGWIYERVEVRG